MKLVLLLPQNTKRKIKVPVDPESKHLSEVRNGVSKSCKPKHHVT